MFQVYLSSKPPQHRSQHLSHLGRSFTASHCFGWPYGWPGTSRPVILVFREFPARCRWATSRKLLSFWICPWRTVFRKGKHMEKNMMCWSAIGYHESSWPKDKAFVIRCHRVSGGSRDAHRIMLQKAAASGLWAHVSLHMNKHNNKQLVFVGFWSFCLRDTFFFWWWWEKGDVKCFVF
jgi:hypothetical protein